MSKLKQNDACRNFEQVLAFGTGADALQLRLYIAVDLGGTKVRVAVCDLARKVVAEVIELTRGDGGVEAVY